MPDTTPAAAPVPSDPASAKPDTVSRPRVMFFGDSISTYEGEIPHDFAVFYGPEKAQVSGVESVEDCWWRIVAENFGWQVAGSASYSGSKVTGGEFPAATSAERLAALAPKDGAEPDLVVIYLGVNDFGEKADPVEFGQVYRDLVRAVATRLPRAQVLCSTLLDAVNVADQAGLPLSQRFEGDFAAFNREVRGAATAFAQDPEIGGRVRLVDAAEKRAAYDSFDGTHPTHEGMRQLAAAFASACTGA